MFTHATNAERPDDDKVLVNARLLVCLYIYVDDHSLSIDLLLLTL